MRFRVAVFKQRGTIGLVMDCDTTGVEPDFALVKFKKLAGGGYFKIINQTVPEALERTAGGLLQAMMLLFIPAIVGVIAATYDPRTMKRSVERSQADHHDACVDATGLEPKEAVAALTEVYQGYRDGNVSLSKAAYECGVTDEEFGKAVARSPDPMIGLLLLGTEITRGSWEAALPDALTRIAKSKETK